MVNFRPLQDNNSVSQESSSKVNFRPLDNQIQATEPQISPQSDDRPITNRVLAGVAGLSNAGAAVGETVVDAGTWLLNKIGAISPNTKKQMDAYVSGATKVLKTEANPNGDMFEKAVAQHPWVAKGSELAVEVPAVIKTIVPNMTSVAKGAPLLEKALSVGTNQLGQIAANVPIAAGMVGASGGSIEDQDYAGKLTAIATPLVNAGGKLIGQAAQKGLLGNNIKNMVAPISKELADNNQLSMTDKAAASISNLATKVKDVENSNYNNIKQIPGTIQASNINQQLNYMLKNTGSKQVAGGAWDHSQSMLEKPQLNAIVNVLNDSSNLKTMDDAINLKRTLSAGYSNFSGKTTDLNYKLYKNIQNTVDTAIHDKAKDAGLGSDWVLANKFHKDVVAPLQDANAFDIMKATANKDINPEEYNLVTKTLFTKASQSPQAMKALLSTMDDQGSKIVEQNFIHQTFKDIIDSPDQLNPNQALLKVNQFKGKFGSVLSKDSNDVLKGLKTLLEDSGAVAGKSQSSVAKQLGKYTLGGGIGAAAGGLVAGPLGAGIGTAIGATAANQAFKQISNLLDTPVGIKLLKGISEGKPWTKAINRALTLGVPVEDAQMNQKLP